MVLLGCSRQHQSAADEEILARVGPRTITATEFRLNYEFGFPHLLPEENRKEAYLHRMIAELLLAQQGYALQLDTLSRIRTAVQTIQEERVIEEVFTHFVLSRIEISPDEILHEVYRSAVAIEFSYLPAATQAHAHVLKQQLQDLPFEQVAAQYTSEVLTPSTSLAEQFRSPLTPVVELDHALVSHLQDLTILEPSDPIFYQNQWYVFVVNNIVRTPLSPNDIAERSVSARKVLYNTKAMQQAGTFVNDTMTPYRVETIRSTFNRVIPHLFALYQQEIPVGRIWQQIEANRFEQDSAHANLYALAREPLVTSTLGTWTVQDFFEIFNAGRYQLRPDNVRSFTIRFSDIIALVVRDEVFFGKARDADLFTRAEVTRDVQRWSDKWVFQEMRTRTLDAAPITHAQVMEYARQNGRIASSGGIQGDGTQLSEAAMHRLRRDYLAHVLFDAAEHLKEQFNVVIDYAMLDTITVSASSANPNMTLQVFNQNSNRMAFPVLDPIW